MRRKISSVGSEVWRLRARISDRRGVSRFRVGERDLWRSGSGSGPGSGSGVEGIVV